MFLSVGRSAVFQIGSGELLTVVTEVDAVGCVQLVVNFGQVNVLIELARVVDRGLRESHCIDLDKLVIKPGEKVFTVFVDIHILDHQGNLI
ncbi:MAG: hypothetical protein AAB401_12500, partial [Acidobacteriota bacterium]